MPEVVGDPVELPLLIVLVGDLEVHLIGDPADADPDHDGQGVGEPAVQLKLGARLARLHSPHTGCQSHCGPLHVNQAGD